jgi:hypothetical protein
VAHAYIPQPVLLYNQAILSHILRQQRKVGLVTPMVLTITRTSEAQVAEKETAISPTLAAQSSAHVERQPDTPPSSRMGVW